MLRGLPQQASSPRDEDTAIHRKMLPCGKHAGWWRIVLVPAQMASLAVKVQRVKRSLTKPRCSAESINTVRTCTSS